MRGNLSLEQYKKVINITGQEPINPIGQCFESAARQIVFGENAPISARLCHGIGVSNMPGQNGAKIGHAWIEYQNSKGTRVALDTTWGENFLASEYREESKLNYVIEYTKKEVIRFWTKYNIPGPWDKKIIKVVCDSMKMRGL